MTNPNPPSDVGVSLAEGPALPAAAAMADRWIALRRELPAWQALLMGLAGILACLALWWYLTAGDPEERIISPLKGLSSPYETFASFPSLWFERALTRNLLTTLRRLALGFGLAALVGIPVGVLCGCFPRVQAFFLPMTLFGRNIPVAALIPLTFSLFGIGEAQKVVFIFIACVAFVIWDTTRAVQEVGSQYIDTAYTLGAGTWQTIGKVLLPLALPSVFNSLRLIFGLAFGYIMLAEVVKFGGETGGLGDLINISQRRGPREHVLLILLIIPIVALFIDRFFFFVQAELFPYRYGGSGILNSLVRGVLHAWEDLRLAALWALKRLFGRPTPAGPSEPHTP
jgi:ABC-type nitrate/sulfonate/bicarbonate transport system permease component